MSGTGPSEETQYRFLPSVRRGLRPSEPYGSELGEPSLAEVVLTVEGRRPDGASERLDAETAVKLYGPGDVIGLDARQVVRTEPADATTDVEPNYFPHVEFDRPDLPWLFSPERAEDTHGRVRPWLTLVVIEKQDGVSVATDVTGPLPVLTVGGAADPSVELPPPDEVWAWAHAQVVGAEGALDSDGVADTLDTGPMRTLSRLVAPRKLQANTAYIACVVPTFEAGRQAGLGADPPEGDSLLDVAWASWWTGSASGPVRLPVYFHWEFATGPRGDFESLVRALEPRDLDEDVGTRPVDLSDPGVDDLAAPGLADGALRLGGALRSVGFDPTEPAYPGPDETVTRGDLRGVLNLPDDLADGDSDDPTTGDTEDDTDDARPVVGPPTYGQWHADVERLPASAGDPGDRFLGSWLDDLNLDPRNRITAGFGTSVVRANQEALMAAAWDQFGDFTWANRLVRAAQLAGALGEVTRESLVDVPVEELLSFTSPMHSMLRLAGAADRTVYGRLADSQLPMSVVQPTFRRVVRPRGPLARRVGVDVELGTMIRGFNIGGGFYDVGPRLPDSTPSVSDSLVEVGALDYLGEYGGLVDRATAGRNIDEATGGDPTPDGGAPAPAPGRTLVAESLGRLDGVDDHCVTARRRLRDLEVALQGLEPVGEPESAEATVRRLVFDEPTVADRSAAIAGSTYRPLARSLARLLAAAPDAAPGLTVDHRDEVLDRMGRLHVDLMSAVDGLQEPVGDEDRATALDGTRRAIRLVDAILDAVEELRRALQVGSTTAAYTAGEAPKGDVTPLSLTDGPAVVDLMDVERPLVEMVGDRLGLDPAWLAGRDDPLEEIMAAPEIERPMYAPLRDLSTAYLCPGVGNIPADTVGVLETNPPFVEAYLVGLSHEMASELLWRRYPTDRRGTYFRRFWDYGATPAPADAPTPTDIAPIHGWLGNDLGANAPGGPRESRIVLIIRGKLLQRYPNTRIYAVKAIREPNDDRDDETPDRVPLFAPYLADIRDGDAPVPDGYTPEFFEDSEIEPKEPIFRGTLAEDVTFFGFDLVDEEAFGAADDAGWFFVLEEPPGEPRFGLDEAGEGDYGTVPAGIRTGSDDPETLTPDQLNEGTEVGWNALSWGHLVDDAAQLESKTHVVVTVDNPASGDASWEVRDDDAWFDPDPDRRDEPDERRFAADDDATWGTNSAHMARITWQLPVRVAVHADDMIPRKSLDGEGTGRTS